MLVTTAAVAAANTVATAAAAAAAITAFRCCCCCRPQMLWAYWAASKWPLVVLTGQPPSPMEGTEAGLLPVEPHQPATQSPGGD